jgi:succinyl-diaminopimelate desuccinylase
MAQEEHPEVSIVSDAAFPIINGEKGIINLRLEGSLPEYGDEIQEDELRFKKAVSGDRPNIVPPKATLVFEGDADSEALQRELERFLAAHPSATADFKENAQEKTITFQGKGAHGSTPEEGHNAALDMLQFMADSAFVSDDEAEMAEFLHHTGEGLKGENLNIALEHDFVGATTVNLGIVNWTRSSVEVIYNIRNTMGLSVADAVSRAGGVIGEFAEETGFELSAAPKSKSMEPIFVDPEKHPEFIGALMGAYSDVTGREASLHAIGGTTYAKVFPNAVCFGPVDTADGEEHLAHQADERVSVEHLLRNVKIYANALARLCAAE